MLDKCLCSEEISFYKEKHISLSCGFKTTVAPLKAVRRSSVYLMLQRAVLPLSLFTDDDKVQIVVASAVARQTVHMNHISKQVQFTPGEWTRR